MERIYLPQAVSRYIARLVAASHPDSPEATADVSAYVTYGASPRAAIAMAEASRAYALLNGRPSVGFEDVRAVASAVLNHRIILNYKARFDQIGTLAIVQGLLDSLDEAGLNLPQEIQLEKNRFHQGRS
jgi:MoxR-like ATPase